MISVKTGYKLLVNFSLRMVTVRIKYGRDQDFINSKLRPFKRRFPRGSIPGAKERMNSYARTELRFYRGQIKYRFTNSFLNCIQVHS